MHVFRRLIVTWRQQEGATPVEAQKAGGWTQLDMTMLYTQTEDHRERDHVGRILDRLRVPNKGPQKEELKAMKAAGTIQ